MENLLNKIKDTWQGYPVKFYFKEIQRKSELPTWQECGKDEIHIGVIRRQKGDRVIVVRHEICLEVDIKNKTRFEDMSYKELNMLGLFGANHSMYCKKCGEFSTRINLDGCCQDCYHKKEKLKLI
jgi:hypothetical protein